MTPKQQAIIDAACEVAVFSKTNAYPQEGTPLFFDFAQKLDALATAINAEYPNFNRNVRMGGANTELCNPAPSNLSDQT
jgi:hypothetical protein